MHIDITAKNLGLTASIETYVTEKLGGLEKLIQRYEDLGEAKLKVTVERATAHHHKGEVFRVAADLVLPKKNLHAEDKDEDAHAAIDKVRNKLHHEIEKYRGEREP